MSLTPATLSPCISASHKTAQPWTPSDQIGRAAYQNLDPLYAAAAFQLCDIKPQDMCLLSQSDQGICNMN
ncbi:unnamed protein product [Fusarium graminearum]|nr:unnamed protein product [Fusarium graminearum]